MGIFAVQRKLHPVRQRSHSHLDEVARVVNGFGQRRAENDQPAIHLHLSVSRFASRRVRRRTLGARRIGRPRWFRESKLTSV